MTICNKSSLVDVECIYEDGKFMLSSFDACVPDLFTVRFRAPADYKAGDVIVFRKEELPVRTPGMASATTDIFRAGAIVHADIDLVGRRAFVWMGGAGGALPDVSSEEQYAGFHNSDGKRVYVVTLGPYDVPVNSSFTIPHGIPNVNEVIRNNMAVRAHGACYANSPTISGSHLVVGNANRTSVACTSRDAAWQGHSVYFTLYYTCTDR